MSPGGPESMPGEDWPEPAILPEQGALRGPESDPLFGVKRLMVAVLDEAIACLGRRASRDVRSRRRGLDAGEWVRSTDRSSPFSFESICDVLGLDSQRLRRRLLAAARSDGAAPRASRSHRVEVHLSSIVAPRIRRRRRRRGGIPTPSSQVA